MTTPPKVAVRRLALGRLISLTGTFAAGTALTFSIYDRTGSAAWIAGSMLFTWGLVDLLAPIGGAIGDRFDRRRLMIVSELAATVCWAVMFLLDEPAWLLAVAFLSSVVEVPYFPASGAAIPNVAGEENLSWANSLISMGSNAGLTLGPMIGGLLVATTEARWVYLANAASYAVSTALTVSVRAPFTDPASRTAEAEAEHRGVVAGFRFVRKDRVLRTMAVSWFAFILGMGTTLVADPVLAEDFGVGSLGFGLLTAALGGGTILGSLLGRRLTEANEARWMVLCSGGVALTGFGVALAPWFWLVLVWVALFGFIDGPTQVAEQNLLQRRTPDVVRGRVIGAWETMFHGGLLVALLAGAAIVPVVGAKGAYAIGGVTGLVGTLLLLPLLGWLPERGGEAEPIEALRAAVPGEPPSG